MTSLSRRTRLLAAPVALALAAGTLALAGPASAVRTSFSNNSGVAIVDPITAANGTSITITDNSQASVYPSTINVAEPGVIVDLNVNLDSLDHTYPDDVDIMLVGPGGQRAIILSDAGGEPDAVNLDLTFDDEADAPLPDESSFTSGAYRPTNYGAADTFPAPAPGNSGASALSVFDGTNAQGSWDLFVVDDEILLAGDISGGWSLDILVQSVPYPSQVNVSGLGTRVSDINLTLSGLSHTYPDDMDVLLVGPGGQHATVMSDAGNGDNVVGVNLVLDDEALTALPDETQISTGTYRPTDIEDVGLPEVFGPPAPGSAGGSALSVFEGTDPNGVWSLYIIDDVNTDQGTLAGWTLDIETDNTPPTGTVSINEGKATTTSSSVTLNLAAVDPGAPTSGVTQMRFSNDGVTFSAYQPYAATASWTMSNGDGAKTVYAQFRDASGIQSAVVSDTITLDTTGPKAKKMSPGKNAEGVKTTVKIKVKANEALMKTTVTKRNVFLKEKGVSGKVKAQVKYNAARKTIVLTPVNDLDGDTTYKVTVKRVQDLVGHKWDQKPKKAGAQPLKYSFKTT